jgi:SAM-dependent methyltransferase
MQPPSRPDRLPLPPIELRQLVGATEDVFYDNPSGADLFPEVPPQAYESVFDWGCGCGRVARQLIQQRRRPGKYVGVDLHRGMIHWCQQNLAPRAENFEFHHQDVHNLGLNPEGTARVLPFPVPGSSVTLFLAWSVFTHVNEEAATFYLHELSRVLHPNGVAITTWFLFEKSGFPMMQEFQNALFINDVDPTNAVIFDKSWLRRTADLAGLTLSFIAAPAVRGFHWRIRLKKAAAGVPHAEFPLDDAAQGLQRPPLMPAHADQLGLEDDKAET